VYNLHINNNRLTHDEDFNFAEIHRVVDQRKLYNDVSETQSTVVDARTVDSDCSSIRYSPRILTTQSVVPQNRCEKARIGMGQPNDEVVGSVT